MCSVMPTISEDGVERVVGVIENEEGRSVVQDSKIEQLMVNMLDQRDKLLEQLRESQRHIDEVEDSLRASKRENESLKRQLEIQTQHLPGVCGRVP